MEEFLEGFWLADGKASTLIQFKRRWVEGYRSIPEVALQLHFARVIPYIGGHNTTRSRYPRHFSDHPTRFWYKIQDEAGDNRVISSCLCRYCLRIAGLKAGSLIAYLLPCKSDISFRAVNSFDFAGRRYLKNRLAKC